MPTWIDKTIVCFREKPDARIRLLCFHHAGGSASIFKRLSDLAPEWLEVCAVQLPGRENRANQPHAENTQQIVPEVALAEVRLPHKPTIVLGHSLGAFIAFEFVKFQQEQGSSLNIKALISVAAIAPHLNDTQKNLHLLSDKDLIKKLRDFEGTPAQILEDEELLKVFLPRIRADFRIAETYMPVDLSPIDVKVVALSGTDDKIAPSDQTLEWQHYSTQEFDHIEVPGSHFFLHENLNQIGPEIFRIANQMGT